MIVTWLGDNDSMIPNVGMANTGEKINMPDSVALAFVKQGLAELPKAKQPVEETKHDSLRSK